MAQNNAPLQVYDIEAMDFTVIDDTQIQRTDIERAKDYVGEGKWGKLFKCVLNIRHYNFSAVLTKTNCYNIIPWLF